MRAVVTGGIGGVVDTFGKSLKYATCFGKLNYGHKVHGAGRGQNEGQMRIKIGGQGRLTRPTIGLQRISAGANLFPYRCI